MQKNLVHYAIWAAGALCAGMAFGQNAPQGATIPPGNASAFVNVVRTVANLDRAVGFYRDVYGLEVKSEDMLASNDASLAKVSGIPGAKVRRAVLNIPGAAFGLELVEYTGVKANPVQLRLQDTGSTNIYFRVRDIDATLAAAKKMGAKVVTKGGEPMETKNANNNSSLRSMFVYDSEGMLYEVAQNYPPPTSTAPPDSKVLLASFTYTSAYSDKLAAFYKALGIELRQGANAAPWTQFREDLTAAGHTSLRNSAMMIPQATERSGILEYAESDGKPFTGNVQDPGSSRFLIRVHDVAAAAQAAKAAGGSVISTGGEPVKTARVGTRVIVRAPDGFFLELVQE